MEGVRPPTPLLLVDIEDTPLLFVESDCTDCVEEVDESDTRSPPPPSRPLPGTRRRARIIGESLASGALVGATGVTAAPANELTRDAEASDSAMRVGVGVELTVSLFGCEWETIDVCCEGDLRAVA